MTASRASRVGGILALAVLAAFCVLRLEVSNDITRFVPLGEGAELTALARRLIETELTRGMVLMVGGGSGAEARLSAAAALAEALREHPEAAWVRAGVDESQLEAFFELAFPRRFGLVSDEPEREIPLLTSDAALRERAAALREQLRLPSSPLAARLAPRDPLGLFERQLERFRASQPELRLEGGQFLTADGQWAVVFLGTRSSPFQTSAQRPLLEAIEARFAELAAREPGLVLDATGVNRFAVATEDSVRADMSLISIVSVAGVCGVFLLFFRSLGALGIALVPTFAGTLVAVDLGILLFHPIHGVTLAFGVSLVGIAIDYSIHLLNHHTLVPEPGGAWATMRRLLPTLLLGAGTTIAAFAGLAFASFPGIREIGIFASLGVGFSLLATLVVVPGLAARLSTPSAMQRRSAEALGRAIAVLEAHPRAAAAIPLAALALCALGLPRLHWMDDPARLTALDARLVAEDARVRERVSHVDPGRFVIAVGADEEAALRLDEQVRRRLRPLILRGELGRARSVHSLLWSRELQERNRAALLADATLPERLDAAFSEAGFRPGAFAAFAAELREPRAGPLTPDELAASPIGAAQGSLLVRLGSGEVAAITYLEDVRASGPVAAALAGLEGVTFFDQKAFVQELYASFRTTGLRLIGIGTLLVFALVLLRYRRLRPTIVACLPAVLAAATVFACFGLAGLRPNLLDLVSLVLVLGMGVDYGVFVVDSARDPKHLGATMLSVLLSALTTVFAFGALALSSHPALRSIGLTSGLGMVLAFVFAPTALALTGERRRDA